MAETKEIEFYIGWLFSDLGWLKVNSDGSVKPNLSAGCEGVYRDETSGWLVGCTAVVVTSVVDPRLFG